MNPSDVRRLSNRALVEHLADAQADDLLWPEFITRFHARLRLTVLRAYQSEAGRNADLDTGSVEETAEDLTQEVFLKLLESHRRALSRFRGKTEHSIYTYLSAIGVNLVRDHFRRLRAQKTPRATLSIASVISSEDHGEGPSYENALVCDSDGPERYVAASELRQEIASAIEALSDQPATTARDRLVFRLFFVEGLTISEIATIERVGLSTSGVEKCIRRIRGTLKNRLTEGGERPRIASLR